MKEEYEKIKLQYVDKQKSYINMMGSIDAIEEAIYRSNKMKINKNCKHESDWHVYTSNPPVYKCKKCHEYYPIS